MAKTVARYVDGYVLPVPKKNVEKYRRIARIASKVWKDHGALEYRECVGEDLNTKMAMPFTRGIRAKPGETVVFAWVTYKSRAHRDRVNARVMKDPRLSLEQTDMPFDCKRILFGGFKIIVQA